MDEKPVKTKKFKIKSVGLFKSILLDFQMHMFKVCNDGFITYGMNKNHKLKMCNISVNDRDGKTFRINTYIEQNRMIGYTKLKLQLRNVYKCHSMNVEVRVRLMKDTSDNYHIMVTLSNDKTIMHTPFGKINFLRANIIFRKIILEMRKEA